MKKNVLKDIFFKRHFFFKKKKNLGVYQKNINFFLKNWKKFARHFELLYAQKPRKIAEIGEKQFVDILKIPHKFLLIAARIYGPGVPLRWSPGSIEVLSNSIDEPTFGWVSG